MEALTPTTDLAALMCQNGWGLRSTRKVDRLDVRGAYKRGFCEEDPKQALGLFSIENRGRGGLIREGRVGGCTGVGRVSAGREGVKYLFRAEIPTKSSQCCQVRESAVCALNVASLETQGKKEVGHALITEE